MSMEVMPSVVQFTVPFVALFIAVWVTYCGVLKGQPVSDDCSPPGGIALYDGKLQLPISFGNLWKKFRWEFGKKPNPNRNWKQDKQLSHVVNFVAHHRLNLWLFCGVTGLLYLFLRQLLPEKVAFLAVLLWIAHPLGCQVVSWVSGCGYLCGAFFMLIGLNVIMLASQLGWYQTPFWILGVFLCYGLMQWLAVEAMFVMLGVTLILLFLHQWPFAILSSLIACYGGFNTFREALTLRAKVFHEQQMGQSTKFYPRKLIFVCRALWYNVKLVCWPKSLGLYSDWSYHLELPYVESEDSYFYYGLIAIGLLTV